MGQIDMMEMIARIGLYFIPFLFALSFHEFAHAWVAKRKGDNTAELMGRLNVNPFAHADMIGTFLLPMMAILSGWNFLFGWAKPVPVNAYNLRYPKEDMFWIAIAGPLSNLFLAIVGAFIFVAFVLFGPKGGTADMVAQMLSFFIVINLVLCIFNMIPLHPLDGGKVMARFLPDSMNRMLEEQQMALQVILIVFFVTGGFRYLAIPVFWLRDVILGTFLGLFSIFI